jgi:hypothetical protein
MFPQHLLEKQNSDSFVKNSDYLCNSIVGLTNVPTNN